VRGLSREKLLPLLRLKYREAISNAVAELGKPEEIGILFDGFQNFLQRQEGRKAGCARRADGALNPVIGCMLANMKGLALLPIAVCLYSAQGPARRASFEAVEVEPVSAFQRKVASQVINGNRYEYRGGNFVDFVDTAYSIAPEKVLEGPMWVEYDRYDIIARIPPDTSLAKVREMLQTVLATRFGLVTRSETRQLPAVALVAGKKLQLKPTSGSPAGCRMSVTGAPPEDPQFHADCHNMTMAAFADQVRGFPGGRLLSNVAVEENAAGVRHMSQEPIHDKTDLKGAWDFTLTIPMAASSSPGVLAAAIEDQLGLKFENTQVPFPVVVIEKVNRVPTPNSPGDVASLAVKTPEFEVAEIKPFDMSNTGVRRMWGLQFPPGGRGSRVTISGMPLSSLIQQAWSLQPDKLVGGPKWLDTNRWEIVAKLPVDPQTGAPVVTAPEAVWPMLRALLADRFKLTTHFEEREVTAYKLVAVKPKFGPADPGFRTKCSEGPGANGKDPRKTNPALSRLVTCRNVTMDQFSVLIENFSWGYFADPVINATDLEGTWDITLSFSPWSMVEGNGPPGSFVNGLRVGGGMRAPGDAGNEASAPSGAVSFSDALEKQLGLKLEPMKRKVQVMVIDHIEQKPSEN